MAKQKSELNDRRVTQSGDDASITDVIHDIIKQFDDAEPVSQPQRNSQREPQDGELSTFLIVHVVGDRPNDAEKVKSAVENLINESYGRLADKTLRPIVCTVNSATERTHALTMLRAMDRIPPQDIIFFDSCTPICTFKEVAQDFSDFMVRHFIVKMSDVRDKQTMEWGSDLLRDLQYFSNDQRSKARPANWDLSPAWMVLDLAMPMCCTLLVNRVIQMHHDIRNSK